MAADSSKLLLFMLILVIAGIAFGAALAELDKNQVVGSSGLMKKQVLDAVSLITSDPGFKAVAGNDPYWVGNVTRSSCDKYGYINTSGTFVDVPVQIRQQAPMRVDILYTVDLDKGRIMAKRTVYSELLMGSGIEATVPQGSYFYVSFDGSADRYFSNYDRGNFSIGFPKVSLSTNDGDILYPMFLDSSNFAKLRNGTQFDMIQFTDKPSNVTYTGYGNVPMVGNWSAYVPAQKSTYYLVFRNSDNAREAHVMVYELGF